MLRSRLPIALVLSCLPVLALLYCAAISDEAAQGSAVQSSYYDPNSPDNNAAYFDKVRRYFTEIRFSCDDDELHRYTATRYIASQPPGAAVYVENHFLGTANDRDLYFKPGQYVVSFYKSGQQWSQILVFAPGKNATVVVRQQ
jgi:hypothetical protein